MKADCQRRGDDQWRPTHPRTATDEDGSCIVPSFLAIANADPLYWRECDGFLAAPETEESLVKSGANHMGVYRMAKQDRSDQTVGSHEKKHGLPAGTIRDPKTGRDTRSDKKIGTIRKETSKKKK